MFKVPSDPNHSVVLWYHKVLLWHWYSSGDGIPALEVSAVISTQSEKTDNMKAGLWEGWCRNQIHWTEKCHCCLAGSNQSCGVSGGISAFLGRPVFKKLKSKHSSSVLPRIFWAFLEGFHYASMTFWTFWVPLHKWFFGCKPLWLQIQILSIVTKKHAWLQCVCEGPPPSVFQRIIHRSQKLKIWTWSFAEVQAELTQKKSASSLLPTCCSHVVLARFTLLTAEIWFSLVNISLMKQSVLHVLIIPRPRKWLGVPAPCDAAGSSSKVPESPRHHKPCPWALSIPWMLRGLSCSFKIHSLDWESPPNTRRLQLLTLSDASLAATE